MSTPFFPLLLPLPVLLYNRRGAFHPLVAMNRGRKSPANYDFSQAARSTWRPNNQGTSIICLNTHQTDCYRIYIFFNYKGPRWLSYLTVFSQHIRNCLRKKKERKKEKIPFSFLNNKPIFLRSSIYTKAHDLLDCKSSFCWCMYIVGGNNSDWRSKFRFFVIRIYSLYTSDEKKTKKTRESLKPGSRRRHFILSYGIFLRLTHRDDTFFPFWWCRSAERKRSHQRWWQDKKTHTDTSDR